MAWCLVKHSDNFTSPRMRTPRPPHPKHMSARSTLCFLSWKVKTVITSSPLRHYEVLFNSSASIGKSYRYKHQRNQSPLLRRRTKESVRPYNSHRHFTQLADLWQCRPQEWCIHDPTPRLYPICVTCFNIIGSKGGHRPTWSFKCRKLVCVCILYILSTGIF